MVLFLRCSAASTSCDWHPAHAASRHLPELGSLEQRWVLLTAALGFAACEVTIKMLQEQREADMSSTDDRGVALLAVWPLFEQ